MTSLKILGLLLVFALQGAAEERSGTPGGASPLPKWAVSLPEKPAPSAVATPVPESTAVSGEIVSSHTYYRNVTESPPMEGLPPVTGIVGTTIEVIKSPMLPANPPLEIPSVFNERVARQDILTSPVVFISASVYDNHRTLLRIHFHGDSGNDVVAWSNVDFNILREWDRYHVTLEDQRTQCISLHLAAENVRTEGPQGNGASSVSQAVIPALTDVETAGPLFHVLSGAAGTPAMDVLEQLHELFRKEGSRLNAAYVARQQVEADRKAQLLANPLKPADITIRYWKGTAQETEVTE